MIVFTKITLFKAFYSFMCRFKLVTCIILCACLFSCKSTKESGIGKIQNVKDDQLRKYCVGKGGGFTGAYDEYILYENGKVFKYDFSYDREIYLKELTTTELVFFLEKIDLLSLEGVAINEPGNMSSYIEVREGDLSINKIVWGAHQYYPPNELLTFHKELFLKLAETN